MRELVYKASKCVDRMYNGGIPHSFKAFGGVCDEVWQVLRHVPVLRASLVHQHEKASIAIGQAINIQKPTEKGEKPVKEI